MSGALLAAVAVCVEQLSSTGQRPGMWLCICNAQDRLLQQKSHLVQNVSNVKIEKPRFRPTFISIFWFKMQILKYLFLVAGIM